MIALLLELAAMLSCARFFSELAFDNNRNRWLYGALAFVGAFVLLSVFVTLTYIILIATKNASFLRVPFFLELVAICLTGICTYFIYKAVERNWEKTQKDNSRNNLLDK